MSLQRKIYEQLAGLMEVDLRTTRGDSQRLRDTAERNRRQREREQRLHQTQVQKSGYEPEGDELAEGDEIMAYQGSKLIGSMPVEKTEMDDSIEAAKNLWPKATSITVQSKGKTLKTVKVK